MSRPYFEALRRMEKAEKDLKQARVLIKKDKLGLVMYVSEDIMRQLIKERDEARNELRELRRRASNALLALEKRGEDPNDV